MQAPCVGFVLFRIDENLFQLFWFLHNPPNKDTFQSSFLLRLFSYRHRSGLPREESSETGSCDIESVPALMCFPSWQFQDNRALNFKQGSQTKEGRQSKVELDWRSLVNMDSRNEVW